MKSLRSKSLVCILFVIACVFALAQHNTGLAQTEYAGGQVLVKFREGVQGAEQDLVHQSVATAIAAAVPEVGVQKVTLRPSLSVEQAVEYYRAQPSVEFAEPNGIWHATFTPNDSDWSRQWGPVKIKAPEAWDLQRGSASVKIAILDTGINKYHPDLSGKVVAEYNATGGGNINDGHGHGTHCAGIAAANTNNGLGIAGVGFNSALINVKVLTDQGWGYWDWVARGIIWAADQGARVISMSLGGSSPSDSVERAINYAWSRNCVIVAAAGNNWDTQRMYPAAFANCIAVAASDPNDRRAWFSSYGADWVAVAAPGTDIYSTYRDGYAYLNGTSMACPHVSGEAALLWSALGTGTSNRVIRDLIEATADQVGSWVARGRVNVFDALRRTRETWVDFRYRGERHGTFEKPFSTGVDGISGVVPGTTLYIKAGSTAETMRITRAMTIRAYGGAVILGRN
jgi:thermitase